MSCFNIKSGGKAVEWISLRFVRALLLVFSRIVGKAVAMAELRYQKSFESVQYRDIMG